ncbi:MAG: APC family permease [Aureliella sp.]
MNQVAETQIKKEPVNGPNANIGFATLVALVIANMIGAGVFSSSGFSMAALGNPSRIMLAWAICGAWAMCGAIAYGALAARLPLSGGEYLFLSRLVHPSVGFLAGWISLIAGFTAPIAVAAKAAARYGLPTGWDTVSQNLAASALIAIVAATLWLGISIGSRIQNLVVIVKLCLLAAVAVWALVFAPATVWQGAALPDQNPSTLPSDFSSWMVLVGSMSWIALSYTGFNAAVYVAGSASNARKSVPRAMIIATALVTVFYLVLNYIFVFAPQPELIAGKPEVAAIAAQSVGGDRLENLVRISVTLSMISSVFAMLLAGPRVYQRMAADGVMPKIFLEGGGSPKAALLLQATLSIVAVFIAGLLGLMEYLGLTLSACGALTILSLLWVGRKYPEMKRLSWLELTATLCYLAMTAALIAASYWEQTDKFYAMAVTFAVGLVVYIAAKSSSSQSPTHQIHGTTDG